MWAEGKASGVNESADLAVGGFDLTLKAGFLLAGQTMAAVKSSPLGGTQAFDDDLPESLSPAEPLHGIQDLDAGQLAFGIIICSYAFTHMLRGHSRLPKRDA